MSGGGSGYTTAGAQTQAEPWSELQKYLIGKWKDTDSETQISENRKRGINESAGLLPRAREYLNTPQMYYGMDYTKMFDPNNAWKIREENKQPLTLTPDYYMAPGQIKGFGYSTPGYGGETYYTDVARKGNLQDLTAAEQRLQQRANTQNPTVMTRAEDTLSNIITGANKISPTNMLPATIAPGPSASVPTIGNTSVGNVSIGSTPTMNAANLNYQYQNDLNKLVSGDFLRGETNPYLQGMVNSALRDVEREYTQNIVPTLNTQAVASGRYGGGAWADLQSQAQQNYLNSVEDITQNMYGQAYEAERGRMMQGLDLGRMLAETQAGYTQDANRLNTELGFNKALQQALLSRDVGEQQAAIDAERALSQAGFGADIGKFNVENDINRILNQAQFQEEANRLNMQAFNEAQTQNLANQLQGITYAPDIREAGYGDINNMLALEEDARQYYQSIIDSAKARQEWGELQYLQKLGAYSGLISGDFGGQTTSWSEPSVPKGGK